MNPVNIYRVAHGVASFGIPLFPRFCDYVVRLIFGCVFPHTVVAGKGLTLGYGGLGIVVHSDTVMGDNVHIDQQVTIGGNARVYGVPLLGSNIYIGAGAKIIGPVTIGDGSVIGANAVVVSDIPAFSVAVGVPARVVKKLSLGETYVNI